MVPVGVNVNRRQYNKSFKTLKEVAWECFKAGQNPELIEPLIREAGDFDNITGVVFDDFQRQRKGDDQDRLLKNLWSIHDRLHNNEVRPLNMWMVLYTCEFGMNAEEDEEFLRLAEPFDGIIMWTWEESAVPKTPEKYESFKKLTEGKRRMFGCYLYNFGEKKQATGEAVKWQLDFYREKLLAGEVEGIVLHTNTMADLDRLLYDFGSSRLTSRLHGCYYTL